MALRSKIVYLIRFCLLDNTRKRGRVSHVTMVKNKIPVIDVRCLIQMINTVSVQKASASFYTVHCIVFLEQKSAK